ncbi:MAG: dienelactone hydrolase family protein [Ignavibacteriales bacterium]|nr:dienelactone hydrolase family protein [Ignavibacteriales bacterium]
MNAVIILLMLFISTEKKSQTQQNSCCSVSSTTQFAMLSSDKNFERAHESPLAFNYEAKKGKFISFATNDSLDGKAFLVESDSESDSTIRYLFVIHEWWGLNDYIQREAERMQEELGDVNILALDLYDGKVATTPEEAGNLMQSVSEERAKAIIKGAIKYAGGNAKIATIGWCFGGGWSLQTSLIAEKKSVGCIIYYGMPEKDSAKLATLNCDVLGIFGTKDKWISPDVVKEFETNMKKANKSLTVKNYDADHAFANPSNPHYDKKNADDAHKYAVEFLKKSFK